MGDTEYKLIEEMLPLLVADEDDEFTPEQRESAHKFKKFLDHLPGGFFIYRADKSEELLYANMALVRMFECDSIKEFAEFTGRSFKGMVYSEDYDAVEKSITQQIMGDNSDNLDYVEYRILTKKGNMRYVEDYGHFVQTNVGDIYYVFITDATVKTTMRQRDVLQKLEIIEGLSDNYDSILYVDLDTDSVVPYRMSKRLVKQFDGEVKAKPFSWVAEDFVNSWVHPDDQQTIREALSPEYIRRMLQDDRSFYVNFKCLYESELQYMQLRVVDVKNNGHVSQVVIGSRNIEDEIKQEMQQKNLVERALEDARIANNAKNTFLSNMSHDMRTPLNALFGYLGLAKKNIGDSEAMSKYLDSINNAGKQLLDLVDKVLEISYLDSKDFHFTEEPCSLIDIIKETCDELAPLAKKKKIDFTLDCPPEAHPEVYADKEQIKNVLMNIASNAVKYTGKGGKVNFLVEEIPSASSEFAAFRFVVTDTGIGISPSALEKIFDPFEREQNSTHSGVFGSGLGLTIAKQIVESMGGSITAQSELGVGSTFTVVLSFRLSEKKETIEDTDDVEAFVKGKKILVVEDNEINLEIETELLEDLGIIVEPAENGQIAVDKMKVAKPGEYLFILMDIQMPVMDGWEATEAIRSLDNPKLANIPIIALSANAFESDKRQSAKTGMNAHLNKPIDIPVLLDSVQNIVMKKKK
ncbi:MAG: response regulator [Clostridiales bacterium]|nr:response regulator [Clostridiales bacterium]